MVELLDEEGELIQKVKTDEKGLFIIEIEQRFEADQVIGLKVKKDNRESVLLVVTVEETENTGLRAANNQIQAAQITNGVITVDTIVYDNTRVITGQLNRTIADNLLRDKLGRIVYPFIKEPNYEIELIPPSGGRLTTTVNNGYFTFNLNQPLKSNTEFTVRLKASGKTGLIFGVYPFEEELGESLKVRVQGRLVLEGAQEEIQLQPKASPNSLTLESSFKMEAMDLEITDTLANSNWHITASAPEALVNENGNTLSNALYFSDSYQLHPLVGGVTVATEDDNFNPSTSQVTWNNGEEVVFQTAVFLAEPGTTYSTDIVWTLHNTSQ